MTKAEANKELAIVASQKLSLKETKAADEAKNNQRLNDLAASVAKRIRKHWAGKPKDWKALLVVANDLNNRLLPVTGQIAIEPHSHTAT